MYLYFKIPFVLILSTIPYYVSSNCGCSTNRNSQCKDDLDPSHKYLKESNEIPDNNDNELLNTSDMVLIEGTTFEMGTNKPVFESDNEGPLRNVTLKSFYLDKYEISNQKFYDFVKKTGYTTEAEIFGDSFLFEMCLPKEDRKKYQDIRAAQAPWWVKMKGVSWKHPEGPDSTIEGKFL